jgi:hypothetical protein
MQAAPAKTDLLANQWPPTSPHANGARTRRAILTQFPIDTLASINALASINTSGGIPA